MPNFILLLGGLILLGMTLGEEHIKRWPLSPALVYLLLGWTVGHFWLPADLSSLLLRPPHALVMGVEWAVLISLFGVGLRLPLAWSMRPWRLAAWLASVSMLITIALATVTAQWMLDLGWAGALALGAMLSPTDPVLASEVQMRSARDSDAVRMSITAEGGLNDGTALPVVMLALVALGRHEAGPWGLSWLWWDMLWPVGAGAALGVLLGRTVGAALRHQLERGRTLNWDELLFVGAIALAYGLATVTGTSTFIVVFVTALTLFHGAPAGVPSPGTPAHSLHNRLGAFGGRCERLMEVSLVLMVGLALSTIDWHPSLLGFALLMVMVIRPLSVVLVLRHKELPTSERRLIAWFGIRGVGTLFYLLYILQHDLPSAIARELINASVVCVAMSILLHGVSATPLMNWYQRRRAKRQERSKDPA